MADLVRSASLTSYDEVARSAGLDPFQMLRRAGLPQAALSEPDLMIPAQAVRQLLEDSAALSGVDSFGLQMAETRRLSNLGMVGMLARDEPTLRLALQALIRYGRLHNQSLYTEIEEAGGIATIREELLMGGGPVRQSAELVQGVLFRILRIFLGPQWSPRRVCFIHPAPLDLTVHRRLFGWRVDFGCDFNGIVCASRDLDLPIASSDPVMARYARQSLEAAMPQGPDERVHEVRQLILVLLPTGRCSVEQVALHLGLTRRTLHRQLAQRALSFSGMLQTMRSELATRYLASQTRPLSEIAALLGFSSLSAFSRWKRHLGQVPPVHRQITGGAIHQPAGGTPGP